MLNQTSTTAIARTLLLAGILLVVTVLAARSFFPAFAQEADEILYDENRTDEVTEFIATDPEMEDVTWSLSDGGDVFDIDSTTGVLTFENGPPDYENPSVTGTDAQLEARNTYTVTAVATESGTTDVRMGTKTVTVKVTDDEEDGVITFNRFQPKVGFPVTATLMDDDGIRTDRTNKNIIAETDVQWAWYRSENKDGPWTEITATTTTNTNVNTNTRTPEEADKNNFLRVEATYYDGNSPADAQEPDNNPATLVSDHPVLPADYMPEPPEFLDDDKNVISTTTREVLESKGPGDAITPPVKATDYGADDEPEDLIYSISESQGGTYALEAGIFVINDTTGQLSLGDTADLDYDGASPERSYTVHVKATDPTARIGTIEVTVVVIDVNEPPVFADGTATSTEYAENDDIVVADFNATDPEEEANLKWSLDGSHRSRFSINNQGQLSFNSPPDYESTSAPSNNHYRVTIEVSDRGDEGTGQNVRKATLAYQVEVTNEQEGSEITLSQVAVVVNRQITARIDDPDKFDGNVAWTWTLGGTPSTSSEDFTSDFRPTEVGTVNVTAVYTDGEGANVTETGLVAVLAAVTQNQAPVFATKPESRSVSENLDAGARLTGGSVTATDGNSEHQGQLTYKLEGRNSSLFSIDISSGEITTRQRFNRETISNNHTYSVTVRARDPEGGSDTVNVNVEVTNVNEPPMITSGDNAYRYAENGTSIVGTFTATDPEDSTSDLTWSVVTGGNNPDAALFEINSSGQLSFIASPNYEDSGDSGDDQTYDVRVQVEDTGDDQESNKMPDSIDVDVVLNNVQEAGTVTITPDSPVKVGEPNSTLTAELTDPDGEVTGEVWQWSRNRSLRGSWTQIEGATSTTYMPVATDAGHYLQATVTYDDAATPEDNPSTTNNDESRVPASEETRFVVAAEDYENTAPRFLDAEGNATTTITRMVDENSPAGTNVGDPFAATDPDVNGAQENLIYEFDQPDNDSALFRIELTSEGEWQIKVKEGMTIDYEDETNRDHLYTVMVKATDPSGLETDGSGGRHAPLIVNIMVVDVREDPVIGDENEADGLNLVTIEYDENTPTTTQVSLFTATDEDDDFPDTGEPVKVLKWDLEGTDKDDFTIATSSNPARQQLTFNESPDYEEPTDANKDNIYSVRVVVTDSQGDTDSQAVTVTVMNEDEDGTITLSNLQPEAGIPITATLEDPDGGVTGVTWQWRTATSDTAEGSPIPGTEATMQSYTPLDVHATDSLYLRVEATYKDNASVDDPETQDMDESIHSTSTSSANDVQAMDDMNETPQFTDQDTSTPGKQTIREVPEDGEATPIGSGNGNVGDTVTATDEQVGGLNRDVLTYTLGGPDAGSFDIGEDTGQITVAAGVDLDYEAPKNTYTVVVTATDPSLATDEITVTIEVMDIDESPVVTQAEQLRVRCDKTEVPFDENQTGTVATCTASDPDGGTPTWSRSGPDSSVFSISSNGVLSIDSPLDYEPHGDADSDNVYEVTVTAQTSGMSDSLDVEVTLVNVDEDGSVSIQSVPCDQPAGTVEVRVGVELTACFDDGDEQSNVTWQWASSSDGNAPWTNISGATDNAYSPVAGDEASYLQVTVNYDQPAPLPSGQQLSEETTTAVLAASTAGTDGTLSLSQSSGLVSDDPVTATLIDPDNPTNQVWQWQRSSDGSTNWTTISGATSASYTTTDTDAGNFLRASVTYDDDSGTGQTAGPAATSDRVAIHRYDADANGRIERPEVIDAINDFLFPPDPNNPISRDEVIEVINLFLFP